MTLQHRVQDALDELVATGAETGLQVAVHHWGRRVVDAVAGVADGTTGRPVAPETLFFSFSTAKGVAALIAHLLVRNGLVGYDTLVAQVWPAFGMHGKQTATLRHVLTHTVGVPAMPGGLGPADLADWPRVCAAIAGADPRWRPGTRTGYHSFTFGFLVGEIARRVTGQPVQRLLQDWVAAPLGIVGELYFGVPPPSSPGSPSWRTLSRLRPNRRGTTASWHHGNGNPGRRWATAPTSSRPTSCRWAPSPHGGSRPCTPRSWTAD